MAQRLYLPRAQVFSNLGVIGAGFKLYSYETDTNTAKATYSDTALSVANANPTIADSAGRFGNIFVDDLSTYKLILNDADDNLIWSADPVDPKTFSLNDFDPRPTSFWGTTAGTASAYTLDADPAITAYSSKQTFFAACHLDNSASSTIAINGLAALTEKKYDGEGSKVDLEANDKRAGQTYEYRIDGTDAVILNPEKPYFDGRNIFQSTTTGRGVNYLLKPVTVSNGSDSQHDINFTAGNFIFSDGSGMAAASALTKRADATWASGNNGGGMANGISLSNNTPYYMFALSNSDGSLTDFGFDSSKTATNLIASSAVTTYFGGTPKFSYIAGFVTDGSANIRNGTYSFNRDGSYLFYYDTRVQDINISNPSLTRVAVTMTCLATVYIIISGTLVDNDATADVSVIFTSEDMTDAPPSGNDDLVASSTFTSKCVRRILTNNSSQIYYRCDDNAVFTFTVKTLGWYDPVY